MNRNRWTIAALVFASSMLIIVSAAACGSDDDSPTPTAGTTHTQAPTAGATTTPPTPQATTTATDPCTLRTSLEGQPLAPGKAFTLNPTRRWQVCNGGGAAGSSEKFLFRSADGGASWVLISRTTLGNPPAEAGVGSMPNGNGVSALFFQDVDKGWLGLSSPGGNLFKSTNGGQDWTAVAAAGLDAGVPVTSITFTDMTHGSFVTPDGTWTTSDGGSSWAKSP